MKKNLKKVFACCLVLVMAMAMFTACGDKNGGNSGNSGSSEPEKKTELTKEEYQAKITDISGQISEITSKYSADMNSGDVTKVAAATKSMIDEMKPLYTELGDLAAPAEFKDQQTTIKEGCDASLETLDLSLELIELSTNADSANTEDITAKMQELTSQMTELQEKATALTTALQEVLTA